MPNPNTATQNDLKTPNAEKAVEVKLSQLPLHCPQPGTSLWNSHPRVYIPAKKVGDTLRCPYCGTLYTVVED